MKRCPNCHAIYAEEVLLCAFDQSPLVAPEDVFVSVKGSWTPSPNPRPVYKVPVVDSRLPLRWLPEPIAPVGPQRAKKKTLLIWLASLGKSTR